MGRKELARRRAGRTSISTTALRATLRNPRPGYSVILVTLGGNLLQGLGKTHALPPPGVCPNPQWRRATPTYCRLSYRVPRCSLGWPLLPPSSLLLCRFRHRGLPIAPERRSEPF